jgi:subtilase family serine protease
LHRLRANWIAEFALFIFVMLCVSLIDETLTVRIANADSGAATIERNTLPVLPTAQFVSRASRRRVMKLVVGLQLHNRAELDAMLVDLYDPSSPNYRHYLSPQQFADNFAPPRRQYRQVKRFLRAHGLHVTGSFSNRLAIEVRGTVEQVERAFGVNINSYAAAGRTFFANDRNPQVPAEFAGVIGSVAGLDNFVELHAHSRPSVKAAAADGSATPVGYTTEQVATAYDFSSAYANGYNGAGATIAIATANTFKASDVAEFWNAFGVTAPDYTIIKVGRGSHKADPETTLDLERAGAMAPGAKILVYEGANGRNSTFEAVYNRIVAENKASVVTTSWGLCEQQMPPALLTLDNNIFAEAAAQGQAWFAASGDDGAYDCGGRSTLGVDYPASDPNVVAVGGTTLTLDANGGISGEVAWGLSGGGVSGLFAQPPFAYGPGVSTAYSDGHRQIADVALDSNPATGYAVYFKGSWYKYGGTSFAAPQWAAIFALINGARGAAPPVGAGGPNIYGLANGALPQPYPAFNDVQSGINGYYQAGTGWDFATGWGSPQVWNLVRDLL